MKAIVHHRYGTPDVRELKDIDKPDIADDEVLVRLHTAGVDRGVWHLMAGLPYPIRLAGYGLRAPKNPVPGMDVAGVVEAVGKDVTRFQPGDKVFGIGNGSTALQALRDHGQLQPGQTVLIIGASGGVGTYAVQLAKALGAHVTGVCSTTKVDLVRSIGADHVIDYSRDDFADGRYHYDLILDIGGNSPLSRLRRALTPDGTAIIVGGETGGRWLGGNDRQVRALALSPFISQKLSTFVSSETHKDMLPLAQLIDAGKVTPVIERTYPLHDAPKAIRHLEEGHARGKLVISIAAAADR